MTCMCATRTTSPWRCSAGAHTESKAMLSSPAMRRKREQHGHPKPKAVAGVAVDLEREGRQETAMMEKKLGRDSIEHASRDELLALQLDRLKWTLRHAYDNVPHYRKAFDQAGVHPDDVRTLSDIAKFPFTTKQDLRDNYPFDMFAVPREKV